MIYDYQGFVIVSVDPLEYQSMFMCLYTYVHMYWWLDNRIFKHGSSTWTGFDWSFICALTFADCRWFLEDAYWWIFIVDVAKPNGTTFPKFTKNRLEKTVRKSRWWFILGPSTTMYPCDVIMSTFFLGNSPPAGHRATRTGGFIQASRQPVGALGGFGQVLNSGSAWRVWTGFKL